MAKRPLEHRLKRGASEMNQRYNVGRGYSAPVRFFQSRIGQASVEHGWAVVRILSGARLGNLPLKPHLRKPPKKLLQQRKRPLRRRQ